MCIDSVSPDYRAYRILELDHILCRIDGVMIMAFDIIKLLILGVNSGYFLYTGAAQRDLIDGGIGVLLFFVMIGMVGFTSGHESLWSFLFAFIVIIPCNIKVTELLLFDMMYKRYPDSFNMLYVTDYPFKIFCVAFSRLSVWNKVFTVNMGVFICVIILMAELYATGLIVRTIWSDQKRDTFRLFVPAEKAEQEDDVTMRVTWSRKNMYYYAPESETDDEEDVNKKKVEEFDWRREFALEGDKPVGIVRYKKRSKNSSITNR